MTHPWKLSYIDRYLRDVNWEAGHYHVTAHHLDEALPLTIQHDKIVSIQLQTGACQLHDDLAKLDRVRVMPSEGRVVFARLFSSPNKDDWLLLGRRDGIVDLWTTSHPSKRLYRVRVFESVEVATATIHVQKDDLWLVCGGQDGRLVVNFKKRSVSILVLNVKG